MEGGFLDAESVLDGGTDGHACSALHDLAVLLASRNQAAGRLLPEHEFGEIEMFEEDLHHFLLGLA